MSKYNVEYKIENDTLICTFSGRFDTAASIAIENEVFDKVQKEHLPVIFDLKDVEYISSAYLRLCIQAARAAKNNDAKAINAAKFIEEAFSMTGLDRIMKIVKDEENAGNNDTH